MRCNFFKKKLKIFSLLFGFWTFLSYIWTLFGMKGLFIFIINHKKTIIMKVFTEKSAEAKVINSPEYQEYLEFLEEEAMSKNPDDFCFQKPDRNLYAESDFDIFKMETEIEDKKAVLADEYFANTYEIIQAAI